MIKTLYPCFQHWSAKGSVYLVSDTHFFDNDREVMGYNIPESVQLERIISTCHKNDTLIHLGDVGSVEWMNKIKAYKVLIMGNHDQSIEEMRKYFDEVYSGPLWISQKLVLSHEPLITQTWSTVETIAFNIHGHDHDDTKRDYHLNLAQNVFGYLPLNLKYFIEQGYLKSINDIHRTTIDYATMKKNIRKNKDTFKDWYQDSGVLNV